MKGGRAEDVMEGRKKGRHEVTEGMNGKEGRNGRKDGR